MAWFVRCRGKAYCIENEQGCRICGRRSEEIESTRALVAAVADFILAQDYDNAGEFAAYLAQKVEKRVEHARNTKPHPHAAH